MSSRPEKLAPPEIFYNDVEARKYTTSSRMVDVQSKLTERAIELLCLNEDGKPKLLLDIGCGSGLSGETLTENGHTWIGMDISKSMLDVAVEREVEGDLALVDIGQGLGLRNGVFDGVISISAVQWLCNADKTCNDPKTRLRSFFSSLYRCLSRGCRAALQIYPDSPNQLEMISTAAMKAGFSGGLVVDYPNSTRAKKYFLCLCAGVPNPNQKVLKAKGEDGESEKDENESSDEENENTISFLDKQRPSKRRKKESKGKGKAWVLMKKEQRRNRGDINVPKDSKYTARKRKARF